MEFRALTEWSIAPTKFTPNIRAARERRDLYLAHFTSARAERQPEFCPPWVQGQTIGWRIQSPVDVTLGPLEQHEVSPEMAASEVSAARGDRISHVWRRDKAAIAVEHSTWLNAYEYEHEGERHNMFLPNGLGTIEWRLGWTASQHNSMGLLIIPSTETPSLGVEVGFLSDKTIDRLGTKGFSIAIRPISLLHVSRGQEIARIVPISREALAL